MGRASKFGLESGCVPGKEAAWAEGGMPLSASLPLLPPDLGMQGRGGVRAAAPRAGSRLKSRLWGLSAKLEVDQAVGLSPNQCPARWGRLVGLCGWEWRWGPPAVLRKTEGWGSQEKVMLDLLQGRLLYIWKGLESRPMSQHGGWCWHWRALPGQCLLP